MPPNHSHGISNGVGLRVLPLGDSITWGERSTDGNGYREELLNKLQSGNDVEFIGSQTSGSMQQNHHEGWPGFPIGPVGEKGKGSFPLRPNLILLMAGTNDIVFNFSPSKAHVALGHVIGNIIEACPDSTLLVATIPPLLKSDWSVEVVSFNKKIPSVIASHRDKGHKVALVDMKDVRKEHIMSDDGIHPNDEGYKVIAQAWYNGIVQAGQAGWIESPIQPNATENSKDNSGASVPTGKQPVDIAQSSQTSSEHKSSAEKANIVQNTIDIGRSAYSSSYFFYCSVIISFVLVAWYMAKIWVMRGRRYTPVPQS